MKQTLLFFVLITFILAADVIQAQEVYKNSINIGWGGANMNSSGLSAGRDLTFQFTRNSVENWLYNFGFSFSQSLIEVLSNDPAVLREPELVKQGYNGTSMDLFAGAGMPLLKTSSFRMPFGAGVLARIRTESYPDPNKQVLNNGITVLTEMVYKQSFDIGVFASLSAEYHLFKKWSLGIQARSQYYNKGFSIFKIGVSVGHHF